MAKQRKKIDTSILEQASEVSIEGLFGDQAQPPKETSSKIGETIRLSQILPNRFHARQILPLDIKKEFFVGEMDYEQTVLAFLNRSKENPLLQKEIQSLRNLGDSLLKDGQIYPCTGYWKVNGQKKEFFVLETGARRFWAMALLQVEKKTKGEPELLVNDISEKVLFRELSENYQREDLCAVEIGISIASIILLEANIPPSSEYENELDYFREALIHSNRSPEIWDKLEKLFSLPHEQIRNYLQILELSDELIFEAALYRMPEDRIRNVLLLPKFQQENALFSAIKEMEMKNENEQKGIEIPDQEKTSSESPIYLDVLANHIQDWFELANQEYADGNFKDLAKDLASRLTEPSDLDTLARRLLNLSRDIRVEHTKRRQY